MENRKSFFSKKNYILKLIKLNFLQRWCSLEKLDLEDWSPNSTLTNYCQKSNASSAVILFRFREAIFSDMCPDIFLFSVHLPASVDWHDWSCEKVPKELELAEGSHVSAKIEALTGGSGRRLASGSLRIRPRLVRASIPPRLHHLRAKEMAATGGEPAALVECSGKGIRLR
jgi:hypothetical protein